MERRPVLASGFVQPRGYEDAVLVTGSRRLLALGGHVAFDAERRLLHPGDLPAQFGVAIRNLKGTLAAAGFTIADVLKLTIYATDVPAYRAHLKELGAQWKEVFGRHFPAMTLIGVTELMEPGAVVEIDGLAAQ